MFKKIFLVAFVANVLLVSIISFMYIQDIGQRELNQMISVSRNLSSNAAAIRNERADLIKDGIIDFESLAASGDKQKIIRAVPIISAINFALASAGTQGLEFRTPKKQARNPANEPSDFEAGILEKLDKDKLDEYWLVDNKNNKLHYFKPIALSQDCLLCHGSPQGEADPLGYAKEGWVDGQLVSSFSITSDLTPLRASQSSITLTIILFSLLMLALVGFALLVLVRFITKPVGAYVSLLDAASKGNLIARASIASRDEFGLIGRQFNSFLDSLVALIQSTKVQADISAGKGQDLENSAVEITGASKNMSNNVEALDRQMLQLDGAIGSTLKSSEALRNFLNELKELILGQTTAVSSSSSAVEEIVASIHNIAKTAEDKIELSHRLEIEAHEGIKHLNETMDLINKTASSTRDILEMTEVIQKIAAQTNILAMNAAIEAAHAGHAGAGFAVVADEIRNLSENASSSAKRISQNVKQIHSFTDKTRLASENTVDRFNQISKSISSVAQSMLELQQSTKELSEGSNLILEQNLALQSNSTTIKDSSATMSNKIDGIVSSMNEIQGVSTMSRKQFAALESMIVQLSEQANMVSRLGEANRSSMAELRKALEAFKTEL